MASPKRGPKRSLGAAPDLDHRRHGRRRVTCSIITVSDSRDLRSDASGMLIAKLLARAGHRTIGRSIVRDEIAAIRRALRGALRGPGVEVVLLTGGTGIAARDVTIEAVRPLLDKELPGFGELFRTMSARQIGSAAYLSRALAGVVGRAMVYCLPGSPHAVRLAVRRLVLPELPHAVGLLSR